MAFIETSETQSDLWFLGFRNKLYILVPIRNSRVSISFTINKIKSIQIYNGLKHILQWHKIKTGRILLCHFFSCLVWYLKISYNILIWYMLNWHQLFPYIFSIRLNDRSIYSAPRICSTSGNHKSDSPDININNHGHLKFVNQTVFPGAYG